MPISTHNLLVRMLAVADYDVVDRSLRTRAASLGLIERRPGAAKGAKGGVLCLQARHGEAIHAFDGRLAR